MVGPPYSWTLCGGLFVGVPFCQPAASCAVGWRNNMDAATVFVIVIVSLFMGAMIAFQVYIHSGKGDDPGGEKRDRT